MYNCTYAWCTIVPTRDVQLYLCLMYSCAYAWCQVSAEKQTRFALCWEITQRIVPIPCRRFGTPYRSLPIGCPKTSHYTLHNFPGQRRSNSCLCSCHDGTWVE